MEEKIKVWITGSIKLNFDQQLEITQEEYNYLMNENTHWYNISEVDKNGEFNKVWDIVMNQFDIDNCYDEEIDIDDIELEENND